MLTEYEYIILFIETKMTIPVRGKWKLLEQLDISKSLFLFLTHTNPIWYAI